MFEFKLLWRSIFSFQTASTLLFNGLRSYWKNNFTEITVMVKLWRDVFLLWRGQRWEIFSFFNDSLPAQIKLVKFLERVWICSPGAGACNEGLWHLITWMTQGQQFWFFGNSRLGVKNAGMSLWIGLLLSPYQQRDPFSCEQVWIVALGH